MVSQISQDVILKDEISRGYFEFPFENTHQIILKKDGLLLKNLSKQFEKHEQTLSLLKDRNSVVIPKKDILRVSFPAIGGLKLEFIYNNKQESLRIQNFQTNKLYGGYDKNGYYNLFLIYCNIKNIIQNKPLITLEEIKLPVLSRFYELGIFKTIAVFVACGTIGIIIALIYYLFSLKVIG